MLFMKVLESSKSQTLIITYWNLPPFPCHIFKMYRLLHCDGHYILVFTENMDVSMSYEKKIELFLMIYIGDVVIATYTRIQFWIGCALHKNNQIACV